MNRFKYVTPVLMEKENTLACENNVRLYDGDVKTHFEGGELIITTHRLLWGPPGSIAKGQRCLGLTNELIIYIEEEIPGPFHFKRSKKIVLHLAEHNDPEADKPMSYSTYNYVKLSFREGYTSDVMDILNKCMQLKQECYVTIPQTCASKTDNKHQIKLRSGIVGIERGLEEKQKATDDSLTAAFQDLNKLMSLAKDMVKLSQVISTKIKERQGDITEDETVRFKSYLLSLGIDDPVTRDSYKSNSHYYKGLAKEICDFLVTHIEEMGGMMGMTDAYCWINRARGLVLLSPEDILNACKIMEELNMPLKLYQFSSGVMVLQLRSLDSESIAEATFVLVEDNDSLSSEELSQKLGISVTLAKERLLTSEKYGKVCRDDSIEGLRFYPNILLGRGE